MHRYYVLAKIYRSLIKTEEKHVSDVQIIDESDKNMYQMFIGLLGCAKYKLLDEKSILLNMFTLGGRP